MWEGQSRAPPPVGRVEGASREPHPLWDVWEEPAKNPAPCGHVGGGG